MLLFGKSGINLNHRVALPFIELINLVIAHNLMDIRGELLDGNPVIETDPWLYFEGILYFLLIIVEGQLLIHSANQQVP